MCDIQTMFFDKDGYVVFCRHCKCYQVGYGTMLLNLSSYDFKMLMNVLKNECDIDDLSVEENAKTIVIPTSSQETYMIFTKKEASRLLAILEEADNEVKTEQLLSLFQ